MQKWDPGNTSLTQAWARGSMKVILEVIGSAVSKGSEVHQDVREIIVHKRSDGLKHFSIAFLAGSDRSVFHLPASEQGKFSA